jgi:predicted phage terminase large subunit-like protein
MDTNNIPLIPELTAFNEDLKDIIENMVAKREFRSAATRESFLLFFGAYFGKYIRYNFASFHLDMFQMAEDEALKTIVIMGARGSAKSTIMNTGLAIWSILGKPGKHCVVILSQTQAKAKKHFANVKDELSQNRLLKSDLGPLRDGECEWGSFLTIPKHNAQITFASIEQGIRGMRYKAYRPDLIIVDDIEDDDSVRTLEGRNKTYDQLVANVIGAGDLETTRLVLLGTMMHPDCVMMRFKAEIANGTRDGIYREYPIVDEKGNALWKAKYPDAAAIDAERKRIGNDVKFAQEFLLRFIPGIRDIIKPECILRYKPDEKPPRDRAHDYRGTFISVDPAASLKDDACKTAIVSADVFGWGEDMHIYFLPNPVNARMRITETIDMLKILSSAHGGSTGRATIYIEDNATQGWMVQLLEKEGYPAVAVHSASTKEARLLMASPQFDRMRVHFHATGNEELIQQIVGFNIEHFSDLCDAAAQLINQQVKDNHPRPRSMSTPEPAPRYDPQTGKYDTGERAFTSDLRNMRF